MTVVNYSSKMEGDNNNVPDVWSEVPWCYAFCHTKFTSVGHLIEHSRIHLNVPTNEHGSNDTTSKMASTSASAKSDDHLDTPTTNDTPEEGTTGTEDMFEDMPELMTGGQPGYPLCDPRFFNAEELMLMSSLRGTHSTQESMAQAELRSLINNANVCESPHCGVCALLEDGDKLIRETTGSNPTSGIASSSSSETASASAMSSLEHLNINVNECSDHLDAPTTDEIKQDVLKDLLKKHDCEDITIIQAHEDIGKYITFED